MGFFNPLNGKVSANQVLQTWGVSLQVERYLLKVLDLLLSLVSTAHLSLSLSLSPSLSLFLNDSVSPQSILSSDQQISL